MGVVTLMAACFRCRTLVSANPTLVPSIRIQGRQEILCASCVAVLQALQRANNLPVWPDPLPGAYEPCDESELSDG